MLFTLILHIVTVQFSSVQFSSVQFFTEFIEETSTKIIEERLKQKNKKITTVKKCTKSKLKILKLKSL